MNWIHLTDLHVGLDKGKCLWPGVKALFLADMTRLSDQVDGWDLVFFTGDLTQKADSREFDQLNAELSDIWKVISRKGEPLLCVVPGNHDLARPQAESAVSKAIVNLWWTDPGLRAQFWDIATCEYRRGVNESFENYMDWLTRLTVPTVPRREGILPGDFSATFKKGRIALGIVGLNSTFLQIAGGNYERKLDLHVSQLAEVCDGDYSKWLGDRNASVLLTHQPPTWLHPDALKHFRQDIYPPGRFLAHFFGHLHEPHSSDVAEAGAPSRRFRQGPSLFGLEHWGESPGVQRTHGYIAGQFIFEDNGGLERLWPRTSIKGRHGGLNIAPDHTFSLKEDQSYVSSFEWGGFSGAADIEPPAESNAIDVSDPSRVSQRPAPSAVSVSPLDEALGEGDVKGRLAHCPTFPMTFGEQHRHVRLDEQSQFENDLRRFRHIWLATDWGMGTTAFIACSLARFSGDCAPTVFHLRSGDAVDTDDLEALFPQQFGITFPSFCAIAGSLKGAFLVLEDIHPGLYAGTAASTLRRLTNAILDYAPELRLIFTARGVPEEEGFPVLFLRPLEVPEVRSYLNFHSDSGPDLREPDVIESLHQRSDGLPEH